ncbi:MAG: hypothetical protein K2L83_00870 [Muribaculaceae bacterium]|nr:hypothetical protein [Muribaculaceae bacterium]
MSVRSILISVTLLCAAICSIASASPQSAAEPAPEGPAAATDSIPTDSVAATPADSVAPAPQRAVPTATPVDIDREKPEAPVLHYYDRHGNALDTPVRFLSELDTVVNVRSGPNYPAFNGASIGVNFFDAVMMIVGQRQASFDIWADCSIHNWFFPVVEAGVGFADGMPDDGRCNFKVSPSFYARVGMNYNFLYKSSPDYQVFLGLRAGMSSFGYDIYSISAGSRYYYEGGPTDVTGRHATCWYGQVLAGLKVKIYKRLSMGWTIRYAFNLHQSFDDPEYPAWYIPGKGTGPITASFSLIMTI